MDQFYVKSEFQRSLLHSKSDLLFLQSDERTLALVFVIFVKSKEMKYHVIFFLYIYIFTQMFGIGPVNFCQVGEIM